MIGNAVTYDYNKKWIRQGDVLLRPVLGMRRGGARITDGIVARGEVTGHAHRLSTMQGIEHYNLGEGRQLLITGDAAVSLVHEEHAPVEIEPKTSYEIVIDREYDYIAEMARQVED